MRYQQIVLVMAFLLLSCWAPLPDEMPTLQDMQITGRVLHFQQTPAVGMTIVAIVYKPADARSSEEAAAVAAMLGNGLAVGDLILRPRLVDQAHLADAAGYGAVFAMAAVDQKLLAASLHRRQIPCLTRHLEQVAGGSCIVAICPQCRVSIIVNARNAALAGVRFSTAFRIMVRET